MLKFSGCGLYLDQGTLRYPKLKQHNIINFLLSRKAKEIIVILEISNSGKKKEIQFIVDGQESTKSDVSKFLKGDRAFPAIVLWN